MSVPNFANHPESPIGEPIDPDSLVALPEVRPEDEATNTTFTLEVTIRD